MSFAPTRSADDACGDNHTSPQGDTLPSELAAGDLDDWEEELKKLFSDDDPGEEVGE